MQKLEPNNTLLQIIVIALLLTSTSFSQYYYFGRNKVQYDEFDWKILKTDHFDIYYTDEMEELAEIGAKFAEEAFDRLKVKFNHFVPRRIPLIFYNSHLSFQQTNVSPGLIPEGVGGFFEFMKGRVVIPYMGSIGKFKHVINHELVHVFMMNKIYFDHRERRATSTNYPPLWFIEGLAEYWSTDWDTQAEMILRDVVLNNNFVPLELMIRIRGSYLMYKEGQNFLTFVGKKYGEEKVFQLLDNLWRFGSFEEVLEFTLGEKIARIDEMWLFDLKQKYYPLLQTKYPHHILSKKITDWGFNYAPNIFKSDSTNILFFLANRSGYSSVYKVELDDNLEPSDDPELLIQGEQTSDFEAFHLMQPDMDISRQNKIVFVTKSGGSDALHFYSIDDDDIEGTFQFEEILNINAPKFSPDGKFVTFNAKDKKGFSDVFVFDMETELISRIQNDYYDDIDPVFTPDGKSIVFASDRTEGKLEKFYNLFSYNLETRKISYLTYIDANLSMPDYSSGTDELYFSSDYDGTNNLWKLQSDELGTPIGMEQQTHYITSIYDYDFVDSTKFIAASFEKLSVQLYAMDLNEVPDSVKTFVPFQFDHNGSKWKAEGIVKESVQERLSYQKEYSLDYAVSQVATDPVFGTRGGAIISLSDMLSDDRYIFLLYNTAETQNEFFSNFNVAITRINTRYRTNFAYGIFHYSGRRYDIRESDEYFFERSFGGFLGLQYPLSSFQRFELNTSVTNSDREIFTGIDARKALLMTNSISFVHDNSLWGPSGPLDGSRYRFLLGYTTDVKYSNVNYFTVMADARNYYRLSYRSAIAVRASVYINHGKEARRYFAGGSWDLRGWPRWSIRGEKLWLSSVELRFPLIDQIALRLPFVGLGFSNIRGAAFFDAGNAWDEEYLETLGSVGVGLRFNFLGAIVFRYDVGKKIEDNFNTFQPGLFYQFFVGWDF